MASFNHVGNCDELASCAYAWLSRNGVRNIALLNVEMLIDDVHAFVLIGTLYHNEKFTLGDLCDRDDILICDPWAARFIAADKAPNPGAFTGNEYRSILKATRIGDDETMVSIDARPDRPLPLRPRAPSVIEIPKTPTKAPTKAPVLKRSASFS